MHEEEQFIVMCRVSGGVTGTREARLKSKGEVRYFPTQEAALEVANHLNRTMGKNSPASFAYWVELDRGDCWS